MKSLYLQEKWTEPEVIMLSEMIQTDEDKHLISSVTCGTQTKNKHMKVEGG